MKQKFLCLMVFCLPLLVFSQDSGTANQNSNPSPLSTTETIGIKWVYGLSWQQVLMKAKKENKYIFVDCYATWCGPCKQMDKETFSKKDVGEFFNDKFIALKIQMDSTKNDPESVKNWYKDAARFEKDYFVFAYPTQLFFNPQGELIDKITGFLGKDKFINIAQASLKRGKKYEDPYKEYVVLKDNFQKGKKDYQKFPYMISMAKKNGHSEFAQVLLNELHQHLLTLSKKELLNQSYIEFINEYEYVTSKSSANNLSNIFFVDGKKIDSLMGKMNYSMHALNGMIRRGYVTKFLNRVTGIKLTKSERDSTKSNANASIPWDSLYSDIASQFTKEIAEQNVTWAKIWYFDFYRDPRTLTHFIEFTKRYGTEALSQDPSTRDYYMNYMGWIYCVQRESDLNDTRYISELLKKAIENTIERGKIDNSCRPNQFIDTYALLLDKIGDKQNAIKNQMEAIDIYLDCGGGTRGDKQHQTMLKQLSKMQKYQTNLSGK